MALDSRIRVAWPGTAATIPAGWIRDTAFDAKYFCGAAAGANADTASSFGAATHIHTSPLHGAGLQNDHTHTVFDSDVSTDNALTQTGGPGAVATATHVHGSGTSTGRTGGVNAAVAITIDATSNDLAWREVIFISTSSRSTIPVGAYAFCASDTFPDGTWTRVAGDKYLKGAAASSDPAADGGANTHTHTSPPHTHGQSSHTHDFTSDPASGGALAVSSTTNGAGDGHVHFVGLDAATVTNQPVTTTLSTDSGEPPYRKLNIVRNDGVAILPQNAILIWVGNNADIPADYSRVTNFDGKFVKGAAADGQSDSTTGGATQHNHTASSCTPIQDPHTHTTTDYGIDLTGVNAGGAGSPSANYAKDTHTHPWDASEETGTNPTKTVSINNCAAEAAFPPYVKVILIRYNGSTLYEFQPFRRPGEAVLESWEVAPSHRQARASISALAQAPRFQRRIAPADWWTEPAPMQRARLRVVPTEPIPTRRSWLPAAAWAAEQAPPRLAVRPPPDQPPARPSRLATIVEWWQRVSDAIRRRPTRPIPKPPPPPPTPVPAPHECGVPVEVPPTAYARSGPAAPAYSRDSVAAAFSRQAFAPLGAARRSEPALAFGRDAAVTCATGIGYGDSYGDDYGGSLGAGECFPRVDPATAAFARESVTAPSYGRGAPSGSYGRETLPTLARARDDELGGTLTRAEPPDCPVGMGYGDAWGDSYGFS